MQEKYSLNSFYDEYRLFLLVFLLISAASLNGCNSINKTMAKVVPFYDYDKTELSEITIVSTANSNNNMPVEIDFVFIFSDEIKSAFSELSGSDWFINKSALLLRYEKELAVTHVEVVPLTFKQTVFLPDEYEEAVKVLMFANFNAEKGRYLADITQYQDVTITLEKNSYEIQENE